MIANFEDARRANPIRAVPVGYNGRSAFYSTEFRSFPMETEFVASLAQGGTVLEVPCGCGRLTIPLSHHVERLTAVDREPQMILQLRRRLAMEKANGRVDAVIADMRTLELSQKFNLVVCPRESFQLLIDEADAIQALSSFRQHISRSGFLLLDLATFAVSSASQDEAPEYFAGKLRDDEIVLDWERSLIDGSTLKRWRSQRFISSEVLEVTFLYNRTAAGQSERYSSKVKLRIYSISQIQSLLEAVGLKIICRYGNYDRSPITKASGRFLLLAEAS